MTVDQWLERVHRLAPLVEQYRDHSERQRHLAQPLFEALRDEGLFGMWVPRNLGGAEVDVETSVRVVEALSRLDGAVGWNVMIAGNTSILWSNLELPVALDMTRGQVNTVIAGTVTSGAGVALPVDGGFRVTGQWPFASGCHHADWLVCVAHIVEDGEPRGGPDGAPRNYTFVLPQAECEILDTWHTVGLRGTGSHDFRATDRFVPQGRHFPARGGPSYQAGPLYNTSFYNVWAPNIAAVALGIARNAIDAFVELASSKRSARNPVVMAQRESVQEKVGQAEALVRSARALLFESIRQTDGQQRVPDELTALNRLAASSAVDSAVKAVDIVFTLGGTSSIYVGKMLERCFRDVHVVQQHAVVSPAGITSAGRYFLGLGLT